MKIVTVSDNFIDHAIHFECSGNVERYLRPYLCPAGVPTIGIGCTYYEDGKKVTLKDSPITKQRAIDLFKNVVKPEEIYVESLVRDDITQGQFDSLVDFAFNAGRNALRTSTLLKKVNTNPNDPTIKTEFLKWIYGGDGTKNRKDDDGDGLIDEAGEKQRLEGLVLRRLAQAKLYFTK